MRQGKGWLSGGERLVWNAWGRWRQLPEVGWVVRVDWPHHAPSFYGRLTPDPKPAQRRALRLRRYYRRLPTQRPTAVRPVCITRTALEVHRAFHDKPALNR